MHIVVAVKKINLLQVKQSTIAVVFLCGF